jgi:hypothetical protein
VLNKKMISYAKSDLNILGISNRIELSIQATARSAHVEKGIAQEIYFLLQDARPKLIVKGRPWTTPTSFASG